MKTKILITGADNSPGGVLTYINLLVAKCEHRCFEFHVTVSTLDVAGKTYLHPLMTPHLVPKTYHLWSLLSQALQLRKILKIKNIQVFHMHTLRAGFLGCVASLGLPITKIYTGHSWRYPQKEGALTKKIFFLLEKFTCQLSDKITFSTEHDKQLGLANGLVTSDKSVVIRTRIEPCEKRRYAGDELALIRVELGVPGNALLIGTVALMSARKDPLTFVRIAARVINSLPDAYFLWVGDGEMRKQATELAAKLNIQDRFIITGMIEPRRIKSFLLNMNVYLCTSKNEGVPLTLLEAQACGLPIVCSRYEGSGVDEVIQDGITGYTFETTDDAAAAEHLLSIIRNPTETGRMIEIMKKEFQAVHADPALMAKEFENIYKPRAQKIE